MPERLSQDPTFRLVGSEQIWERGAALTSLRSAGNREQWAIVDAVERAKRDAAPGE